MADDEPLSARIAGPIQSQSRPIELPPSDLPIPDAQSVIARAIGTSGLGALSMGPPSRNPPAIGDGDELEIDEEPGGFGNLPPLQPRNRPLDMFQTPNPPTPRVEPPPPPRPKRTRTPLKMVPGPAGMLLSVAKKRVISDKDRDMTMPPVMQSLSQAVEIDENADFLRGPWLSMVHEFELQHLPAQTTPNGIPLAPVQWNIASVKDKGFNRKIPQLAVLIRSIIFTEDAHVVLADPTGEIEGTVSRKVLDMHAGVLTIGAVLVLKEVSVFSPAPNKHHLIITLDNLLAPFPANMPIPGESESTESQFRLIPISTTPAQPSPEPALEPAPVLAPVTDWASLARATAPPSPPSVLPARSQWQIPTAPAHFDVDLEEDC